MKWSDCGVVTCLAGCTSTWVWPTWPVFECGLGVHYEMIWLRSRDVSSGLYQYLGVSYVTSTWMWSGSPLWSDLTAESWRVAGSSVQRSSGMLWPTWARSWRTRRWTRWSGRPTWTVTAWSTTKVGWSDCACLSACLPACLIACLFVRLSAYVIVVCVHTIFNSACLGRVEKQRNPEPC